MVNMLMSVASQILVEVGGMSQQKEAKLFPSALKKAVSVAAKEYLFNLY
jgi:hypothetical protein